MRAIFTARCLVIHQYQQHVNIQYVLVWSRRKTQTKEIWHSEEILAAHNLNAWF